MITSSQLVEKSNSSGKDLSGHGHSYFSLPLDTS
ncbi:hypothetical protein ID866_9287 [Astraeus odoratus]|nr:hypothetical protein ID866_9287 [Astraeus odoratus]